MTEHAHAPRENVPRRRDRIERYTLIASVLTLVLKQFNVIPPSVGIQAPPPTVLHEAIRAEIDAKVDERYSTLDHSMAALNQDVQAGKIAQTKIETDEALLRVDVAELKVEVRHGDHRRARQNGTALVAMTASMYGRLVEVTP